MRGASETGDATYRLIEGITPDKFYTVNGLTPGGTFFYRVMSYYVDGTQSTWSNSREVVLLAGGSTPGDVNKDGIVDINDVTVLIDYLLNGNGGSIDLVAADVNGDGAIDIEDVTLLIDNLMK